VGGWKFRDESGAGGALPNEKIGPVGALFCLLLIAGAVLVLDYDVLPPPYAEKVPAPEDVYARLDFQYNDPTELKNMREEAGRRAARVYLEDSAWAKNVMRDLRDLVALVERARSVNDARERAARPYPQDKQLAEELFKYEDQHRKALANIILDRVERSLDILAEKGVLTSEDLETERNKPGNVREIIRRPLHGPEEREPVERLTDVFGASWDLERGSWREGLPAELERQLAAYLKLRLASNLHLDAALTEKEAARARNEVGETSITVNQNGFILNKGNLIRAVDLEKLREENRAYKASLDPKQRLKHLCGLAIAPLGVLLLFVLMLNRIDERMFQRRRALVMLGLLSLAALAIVKALLLAGYSLALAPFIFVGMVAALAFGQSVALLVLFGLFALSVFAGIRWEAATREGSIPALSLALLVGGVAAALPAARLRDRWDLLKYSFLAGLLQSGLVAGLLCLGEERTSIFTSVNGLPGPVDAWLALLNGPVCGLLLLGSLPLVEPFFGILTNIRLFELADMNQPALRRMQLEAPGTFAHTLQVRNLAEQAAEAIRANTRLVSAGALYHDLGKLLKPEYFVENQMDAEGLHQRLRPSVSALLITAHVKDGIELAHEFGLPQQIIDFIPEHHGTTLISYFYHSAKKGAAAAADAAESSGATPAPGAVEEAFFRYPGPRPRSRETAIVMLADTVEAATRTLGSSSPSRLKSFVHELLMDKMLDGQLDECNLTFAELALIEGAFLRVLVTRYHSRIRYPGQEEEPVQENKTTIMAVPANIETESSARRSSKLESEAGRERSGEQRAPNGDEKL
jgi:putative nucleotidyltransferase with HDIG domain